MADFIDEQIVARFYMALLGVAVIVIGLISPRWALSSLTAAFLKDE